MPVCFILLDLLLFFFSFFLFFFFFAAAWQLISILTRRRRVCTQISGKPNAAMMRELQEIRQQKDVMLQTHRDQMAEWQRMFDQANSQFQQDLARKDMEKQQAVERMQHESNQQMHLLDQQVIDLKMHTMDLELQLQQSRTQHEQFSSVLHPLHGVYNRRVWHVQGDEMDRQTYR
jgi:hypothetical protein